MCSSHLGLPSSLWPFLPPYFTFTPRPSLSVSPGDLDSAVRPHPLLHQPSYPTFCAQQASSLPFVSEHLLPFTPQHLLLPLSVILTQSMDPQKSEVRSERQSSAQSCQWDPTDDGNELKPSYLTVPVNPNTSLKAAQGSLEAWLFLGNPRLTVDSD